MEQVFEFKSVKEMDEWLAINHNKSKGIWIRFYKKDVGIASIRISEALEVALIYGWITGQAKPLDKISWLNRFAPRRPNSPWSRANTVIADRLIKEGKMKPAGQVKIEAAKRDGRWERAYNSQRTAVLPTDFERELNKHERAYQIFKTLNRSKVYEMIFRIETANDEDQRRARICSIIKMLENDQSNGP